MGNAFSFAVFTVFRSVLRSGRITEGKKMQGHGLDQGEKAFFVLIVFSLSIVRHCRKTFKTTKPKESSGSAPVGSFVSFQRNAARRVS
jgi:hypothetical protein